MLKSRIIISILSITAFLAGLTFAQDLEDNWGNFLHYTKIGRLDLAKSYAQAVIDAEPDPVKVLGFVEDNQQALLLLNKAADNKHDSELAEFAAEILDIIEQGRFIRRSEPAIIAEEIRRLSTTARGRLAAVKRLKNAGEYAIPFMVDAMAAPDRREELPNIIWALPQIGRDAIRPLAAALQTEDMALKAEIIKALGEIGYPQSLAYLKYAMENDDSAEIRDIAADSIRKIDPAALEISAAEHFYRLAENYYYHSESLVPVEDVKSANIWFWDEQDQSLVRQEVDRSYFYELMSMRSCEWALRADAGFGQAIGLWIAGFFKAESTGLPMPKYFDKGHASAMVYATTAGPEYLHQALARALEDENAYVALQTIEALAQNAGENSLMYRLKTQQPLLEALTFDNKQVKYSAAIAIAAAGPIEYFAENKIVVENLSEALTDEQTPGNYQMRALAAMHKLGIERNLVIDLIGAEDALIATTKSNDAQLRTTAAKVLAYLNSPAAQRAIAAMALNDTNLQDIRISAFESLAQSAKNNGHLLDENKIDDIYALVSSLEIDPQLRSAAASAYGALNLPSEKVQDLILDQAKI